MNIFRLCVLVIMLSIAISSCKKEKSNSTTADYTTAIEAQTKALSIMYQYGEEHAENDPAVALTATAEILRTQQNVSTVTVIDSTNILVVLTNGLKFGISIDYTDADGISITRGGSSGGHHLKNLKNTQLLQKMKNKKILFYSPPFYEFYKDADLQTMEALVNNSSAGVNLTSITAIDCNLNTPAQFKDYGLVVISTHGQPYGFLVRSIGYFGDNTFISDSIKPNGTLAIFSTSIAKNEENVKTLLNNYDPALYDMLVNDKIIIDLTLRFKQPAVEWYKHFTSAFTTAPLYATSKYLSSQPKLDSTVLLGNFCYSGSSLNGGFYAPNVLAIRDAIVAQSPGAYFCWVLSGNQSAPVSNTDAKIAETQFLNNLLNDLDTTGTANADNTGQPITGHVTRNGFLTGQTMPLTLFGQDNLGYGCGAGTFTDPRDGYTYKTICLKGTEWFAENLQYNSAASVCYDLDPANCVTYGKLYNWTDLMNGTNLQGQCPPGWHVATLGEWQQLIDSVGGTNVAGGVLKNVVGWNAPNIGATNSVGFSALPGGRRWSPNASSTFDSKGDIGFWWTSTIDASDTGRANLVGIPHQAAGMSIYPNSKGMLFSCRCVKDH